jgi:hypothetical protein
MRLVPTALLLLLFTAIANHLLDLSFSMLWLISLDPTVVVLVPNTDAARVPGNTSTITMVLTAVVMAQSMDAVHTPTLPSTITTDQTAVAKPQRMDAAHTRRFQWLTFLDRTATALRVLTVAAQDPLSSTSRALRAHQQHICQPQCL